jgi:two-component system nitrate/nitrite response regulator NarL
MIRRGVALTLESGGFDVVAEVANGPDAVEAAIRTRPDLCLLDLFMPGGGIEAIGEIHRSQPEMPIVVLTVSTSEADLFAALGAGACGFLPKETSASRLPELLRDVMAGEAALPGHLTAKLIAEFRSRSRHRPAPFGRQAFGGRLTEREIEVLGLLADGMATSQIAGELDIRDVTVRRHVSAIVRKTGTGSRSAAVRLVNAERKTNGPS